MKSVQFYHAETGLLHANHLISSDDSLVALNTPDGHKPIDVKDGKPFDRFAQRVDVSSGAVIDYQPPQPSRDHEWDATKKRWILNAQWRKFEADRSTALERIAELHRAQHDHMRRLVLDSDNYAARQALMAIDKELESLKKLL